MFLTNHSEENTVCIGHVLFGLHKGKLFENGLPENFQTGQIMTSLLSMGLWKNFSSILPSLVLGNLLVFTMTAGSCLQGYHGAGEKDWLSEQVKSATKLAVLTDRAVDFFLINVAQTVVSLC